MPERVINIDELEYSGFSHGSRFHAERAPIGTRIGAERLGYAIVRVPPGKRAWPYHAHCEIEEMFYVLAGRGTLRHAGSQYPIRAGDFVCSPADPGQPHQIVNTGDQELMYLAVSNTTHTDVMLYPDSGKYGVWHGDPTAPDATGTVHVFARRDSCVGYWDGEPDDAG